jgi:hypothetical protein
MKQFLTSASRAAGPDGLGSVWKWLIAGAVTFGIAPASVQAQNMMGSMHFRRFNPPRATFTNQRMMNSYMMNSYMMSPYMMGPYMMGPYMSGNSSMYGNSYGSSPMNSGAQGARGNGQPEADQAAPIAPATLFGLPAEHGRVQWPLGLRLLPSNETQPLRDQLELSLYFVATQAAEGQVNRVFIDYGLQAVRDVRQLLRPRQGAMADATYTEAMRFLERAERGLTKMKTIETSPGGASK